MTPSQIIDALLQRFDGVTVVEAWGEKSLFYNPGRLLPRGVYFATLKEKNGDNDRASHLDREGIFRLNIGTTKPLFLERFGPPPPRPGKGGAVDGPWDFTALDTLTPHPVYGWMSWVAVVNPSEGSFHEIKPLIEAAYQKATTTFSKRVSG
ncbi:hypothetical protein E0D97_03655 [Oricola cellulosilytica]|uniref:DUF6194 domain-containing protein n=1 Tax=Oricola cellulosilytica TaxID=1429082 RepID=A0A4R0PIH5_9HYPH|nr:hypothetical protein E0D97_03655 [Oricola cellulosilytica]